MPEEIQLSDDLVLSKDFALFMPESGILAISDLHIGYEAALQAEAVAIPDFQFEIMLERLHRLLDHYSPKRVVINGDMKHEFARNRNQEWKEIGQIVEAVKNAGADITIVRGNHDNYLMTILARLNVEMVENPTFGNFEFRHGHKASNSSAGLLIYGHEHPVVRIRDEIGAMITMPCFLYSGAHRFLILPAFSPLAAGTNVILPTSNFMIKELRGLDLSEARIFTLSEEGVMDFGTVEAVRALATEFSRQ